MLDCWQEDRLRRPSFTSILSQLSGLVNEMEVMYSTGQRHPQQAHNYGFTTPNRHHHTIEARSSGSFL